MGSAARNGDPQLPTAGMRRRQRPSPPTSSLLFCEQSSQLKTASPRAASPLSPDVEALPGRTTRSTMMWMASPAATIPSRTSTTPGMSLNSCATRGASEPRVADHRNDWFHWLSYGCKVTNQVFHQLRHFDLDSGNRFDDSGAERHKDSGKNDVSLSPPLHPREHLGNDVSLSPPLHPPGKMTCPFLLPSNPANRGTRGGCTEPFAISPGGESHNKGG